MRTHAHTNTHAPAHHQHHTPNSRPADQTHNQPYQHAGKGRTAVAPHSTTAHKPQMLDSSTTGFHPKGPCSGMEQEKGGHRGGAWWGKDRGENPGGGRVACYLTNSPESRQSTACREPRQGKFSNRHARPHPTPQTRQMTGGARWVGMACSGQAAVQCGGHKVLCGCHMWHGARTVLMVWPSAHQGAVPTSAGICSAQCRTHCNVQDPSTGERAGDRRAAQRCVPAQHANRTSKQVCRRPGCRAGFITRVRHKSPTTTTDCHAAAKATGSRPK